VTFGQRFARLATTAVVRSPRLWPLFRRPLRRMFDAIATQWDVHGNPDRTTVLRAALDTLSAPPRRALDLGTGTGDAAFAIARRWPDVEVLGVDLSEPMVAEARRKTPPELDGRVRFDVGDSARLPLADASFDLVALNNMIPFADELARVTAPGGHVVVAFTFGPKTPIYVPPDRLRGELERYGFEEVRELAAGPGTAVLARRR
jgi:ubiquinone/menaquinone biosynthesis C-methylase UbiE